MHRRIVVRLKLHRVRVRGDPGKRVETVVLGWGSMGSEVEAIIANHADAGIFGELREWPFLFAREAGVGIIETTHTRGKLESYCRRLRETGRARHAEFLEKNPRGFV